MCKKHNVVFWLNRLFFKNDLNTGEIRAVWNYAQSSRCEWLKQVLVENYDALASCGCCRTEEDNSQVQLQRDMNVCEPPASHVHQDFNSVSLPRTLFSPCQLSVVLLGRGWGGGVEGRRVGVQNVASFRWAALRTQRYTGDWCSSQWQSWAVQLKR